MPVVPVDEHRHPHTGEHDVRLSLPYGIVLPEPETAPVQDRAERDLSLATGTADGRHVAPDLFGKLRPVSSRVCQPGQLICPVPIAIEASLLGSGSAVTTAM